MMKKMENSRYMRESQEISKMKSAYLDMVQVENNKKKAQKEKEELR